MALDVVVSQGMNPDRCVRPGDILTYECTIMGTLGDSTIWTGSAFSGCNNNEVTLVHNRFTSLYRTVECTNGAIVGRSLSVEGNNYTSQLSITFTPDITGTTVKCSHDNGSQTITHRSIVIPTSGLPPCILVCGFHYICMHYCIARKFSGN